MQWCRCWPIAACIYAYAACRHALQVYIYMDCIFIIIKFWPSFSLLCYNYICMENSAASGNNCYIHRGGEGRVCLAQLDHSPHRRGEGWVGLAQLDHSPHRWGERWIGLAQLDHSPSHRERVSWSSTAGPLSITQKRGDVGWSSTAGPLSTQMRGGVGGLAQLDHSPSHRGGEGWIGLAQLDHSSSSLPTAVKDGLTAVEDWSGMRSPGRKTARPNRFNHDLCMD